MNISFIIPFHTARFDNLLQTLRFLLINQHDVVLNSELVTVCQDSIEFLANDQTKELCKLSDDFKIKKHFNMEENEMILAKMINVGVRNCSLNKVVVLESDRILPKDYFKNIEKEIKPKTCITCKCMKKLTKTANDEEITNESFEYKDEYRSEENHIGLRNMWSGNTAFWRDDFFEADMMDEGYIGYGWADSDMTNKMNEIGVKSTFRPEIELHLWHPSQTYGKTNQKRLFINNGIRYCKKWNAEYPDWFKEEIENNRKLM
jgi:hypothetical protein